MAGRPRPLRAVGDAALIAILLLSCACAASDGAVEDGRAAPAEEPQTTTTAATTATMDAATAPGADASTTSTTASTSLGTEWLLRPGEVGSPRFFGERVIVAGSSVVSAFTVGQRESVWSSECDGGTWASLFHTTTVLALVRCGADIVALDPQSGEERWRHPSTADIVRTNDTAVALGTGDNLEVLDVVSGETFWSGAVGRHAIAIDAERLYIGLSGQILAFDLRSGVQVGGVRIRDDWATSFFHFDGERVYALHEDGVALAALSPTDGSVLWVTDVADASLAGGGIMGTTDRDVVISVPGSGHLSGYDRATGQPTFRIDKGSSIFTSVTSLHVALLVWPEGRLSVYRSAAVGGEPLDTWPQVESSPDIDAMGTMAIVDSSRGASRLRLMPLEP